jgi:hypothetical protein
MEEPPMNGDSVTGEPRSTSAAMTPGARPTREGGWRMKWARRRMVPLIAGTVLAAVGCVSTDHRAADGTAAADVSGVWEGGFTVGPRQSGDFRMTLSQEGHKVTGAAFLWGTAGGRRDYPIVGTITGNELHYEPADQSHRLRGYFVVTGSSMVGDSLTGGNYPMRVLLRRRSPN